MISFCLIVRDCEDTLPTCLRSIRPLADEVCVLDTGSTDKTLDILQAHGCRIQRVSEASHPDKFLDIPDAEGRLHTCLADFAWARNLNFDMAKGERIFWIDSDDELRGAEHWTDMLRRFEETKTDGAILPYEYAFDDAGRCVHLLWRERLVRNDPAWRWEGVVHEVLSPYGRNVAMYDKIRIIHHKGKRKRPVLKRRNLEILKAKGDRSLPRTLFYLGTEHTFNGEYKEAIEAFQKYVPVAHEPDELYQALYYLGDLWRLAENHDAAIENYQKAILLRPNWRDAYFGFGACFGHIRDWDRCLHYLRLGR